MSSSNHVYDIIIQPGSSRVLTVQPLKLPPPPAKPITEVRTQPQVKKPEKEKLKLPSAKEKCDVNNAGLLFSKTPLVVIPDTTVLPRAYAVLPRILQNKSNSISPRRSLPEFARFGPVEGVASKVSQKQADNFMLESVKNKKTLFLIKEADGTILHINVADYDKSNWIGLLPLGTQSTANVWLIQIDSHLYGVTINSVPARTPLMVGYSRQYAKQHNIPKSEPLFDLDKEYQKGSTKWWCDKCSLSLDEVDKQQHNNMYHMEKTTSLKLRCKYCSMRFTKRFALKRHVALNCSGIKAKDKTLNHSTSISAAVDPLAQTEEEQRLPSDESLQNFTSILDFSTTLFDTDRISNLDISACNRSDNEFNLMNDFDFEEGLVDDVASSDKKRKKNNMMKTSSPYTCTFCKQTVLKSKVRQHAKLCMQRRFHCQMCRRFFSSKAKLAFHVFTVHEESTQHQELAPYKCSFCQNTFKRRGMLVNHMVRAHAQSPSSAASLPLLVADRCFPCPRCPKLYSASAKRAAHVARNHPGIEYNRSYSIELGQRVKQPSSCSLCPRQYATKAKLRQHLRQRHPDASNSTTQE